MTVSTSPDRYTIVFEGFRQVGKKIVGAGVSVDETGPDGNTPLMFAAMFDRAEVVVALLTGAARPGRVDRDGRRALDYAEAMGAARAAAALR